ncbi:MAG: DNA-directed RNA polymerase subunit alpha [Patescibacteria group bacterium]
MEKIGLPKTIEEKIDSKHSKFVIEPLYPGYGATIGNSLRRVLLSSITGTSATSFKIEGVSHEFTAIPHAKEDVVELMMNLKGISFKSFSDEPVVLELSKKGPSEVTAKDFKANSNVEITNPEVHIITLDKGADFYMEVTVEKGRGFKSVSVATGDKNEIGRIAVDTMFSPVERVSIAIEDTRVGQMTNYDKLTLDVYTNGTITPKEALDEASAVLVEHFQSFIGQDIEGDTSEVEVSDSQSDDEGDTSEAAVEEDLGNKTKVEDLNLSSRTMNALLNSGIKTIGGLKRLTPLKIEEIKGLGKKGIDEIKAIIG